MEKTPQTIEEQNSAKAGAALSSVFASIALTIMKFIVGLLTGSMGILSEAAHSLLDFFAAVLTYYAVKVSAKPVDDDHHFGHGKFESVSALVETGLLFLTSIWVVYEAVRRLMFGGVEVHATWYAFAVVLVSIGVDFFRARALKKVAIETKSQALEADALHFSSDILSSIVVLIGLVLVHYGFEKGDALAAIGVAGFVVHVGWQLGKRTIDVLIDTAPEGVSERVRNTMSLVQGIVGVERVRVRYAGPTTLIDVVAHVDRKRHAESLRAISLQAEEMITRDIPGSDIVLHLKPIALSSETFSERIAAVAGLHGFSVHDVLVDEDHEGKRSVSLDVAVLDTLSVSESHEIASEIEEYIQQEFGGGLTIIVHIDPTSAGLKESTPLSHTEMESTASQVRMLADEVSGITGVHDIAYRRLVGGGVFLSLHAIIPGNVSLKNAHALTEQLEALLRRKFSDVEYVKIHIEPEDH